jgi:hypothetical protein
MSIKNSNDTIGNRNRDLPACSAQPTAPPRVPHYTCRRSQFTSTITFIVLHPSLFHPTFSSCYSDITCRTPNKNAHSPSDFTNCRQLYDTQLHPTTLNIHCIYSGRNLAPFYRYCRIITLWNIRSQQMTALRYSLTPSGYLMYHQTQQDRLCTYKRYIKSRSPNRGSRRRAVSVTCSECVFVALDIRHVKRMRRHIILAFVACPALPFFHLIS